MKLDRRQFLADMLAIGAAISIPVALDQATPIQIDTAWDKLLQEPWYFDVDSADTITSSDTKEPELRSEVFDADLTDRCTVDSLISDIDNCWPLASHFQELALNELEEVQSSLEDDDSLSILERRRLKRLAKALDDEMNGWVAMVRNGGSKGLPRLKDEVAEWLANPIDYNDLEWLPRTAGAQGSALSFFETMPHENLAALGVVIVEGDHPGSTYFAAELRQPVQVANQVAKQLGLPIQFRT
jgi:hypothetical protein